MKSKHLQPLSLGLVLTTLTLLTASPAARADGTATPPKCQGVGMAHADTIESTCQINGKAWTLRIPPWESYPNSMLDTESGLLVMDPGLRGWEWSRDRVSEVLLERAQAHCQGGNRLPTREEVKTLLSHEFMELPGVDGLDFWSTTGPYGGTKARVYCVYDTKKTF